MEGLETQWSTPKPDSVTAPGFYTLIVTSATGCRDTAVAKGRDFAKPDLGPNTFIKLQSGQSADLTALFVTDGYQVRWNTQTPKDVTVPARYRIIAINGGCSDTAYVRIIGPKVEPAQKNGETADDIESMLVSNGKLNSVVYPNPAKSGSKLQVSGSGKGYTITISDLGGKQLWKSSTVNASIVAWPVEKLTAGVYSIAVSNGKEIKTLQLVKE